jgi:hypothetical protein
MSLVSIVVLILLVAFACWWIDKYLPGDPMLKRLAEGLIVLVVAIYILSAIGLLPNVGVIKVG